MELPQSTTTLRVLAMVTFVLLSSKWLPWKRDKNLLIEWSQTSMEAEEAKMMMT